MNNITLVLIAASFILGGLLVFNDFIQHEVLTAEVLAYSGVLIALLWRKLNFAAAFPMIVFLGIVLLLLYWRNDKPTGLNINLIDIYYFVCTIVFVYYLKSLYSTIILLIPLAIISLGFGVLLSSTKLMDDQRVPYLVVAIPLLQTYLVMLLLKI